MPVAFLVAILAVLAGVFFAATGRGGELAYEPADHAPLDLGPVSAADIALLRPPTALWGYNTQVTDEAFDHIARAMRDRDVTIAYLQDQLEQRVPDVRPLENPTLVDRPPVDPSLVAPTLGDRALEYRLAEDDVSEDPDIEDRNPEQYAAEEGALEDSGAVAADAPVRLGSPKPPGVLVAARPHEATQPSEVSPPPQDTHSPADPESPASPEASASHDAAEPSETRPASYDTAGPQGSYDTHGWWAQQEEAARQDALRRAGAQDTGEGGSGHPGTLPNLTMTSADKAAAEAEEQGW